MSILFRFLETRYLVDWYLREKLLKLYNFLDTFEQDEYTLETFMLEVREKINPTLGLYSKASLIFREIMKHYNAL
jgi:hypothetical protein